LSSTIKSYHSLNLKNWDKIKQRYSSYIADDITGQELIIFQQGNKELDWLEDNILEDIYNYTGKEHKIKFAALGGLCANNTLKEHIDGFYPPRPGSSKCSLNIPIKNYDNFEMLWYDGDYEHQERTDPPDLTSPLKADEMQVIRPKWVGAKNLKDSRLIKEPTIVQINIPHVVHNYSDKTRVVLAVRFTPDVGIK
jgi:hypothetical protein